MATTSETAKTAPSAAAQLPSITGPFDPMAMWQQGQQVFTKMMTDSLARWQSFADQYAAIEAQVSTHAQAAVANWSQLAKDAIVYGTQLSAEGRTASVDAAKKMGVGV